MDHVPRPVSPDHYDLVVPYLDPIPYYLGTFYDFWQIAGFGDRESGFMANHSAQEYATLTQSWLYFGLISECLGREVDPSEFIYTTLENERILTSAKFMSQLEKPNENPELRKKLGYAKHMVHRLSCLQCAETYPLPVISLSVYVLISSLGYDSWDLLHMELDLPWAKLLLGDMQSRDWCPHESRKICSTLPPNAAYFMAGLHRQERLGTDHSRCSELGCVAYNVNETTYQTRHVDESCQCSFIGIDQQTLIDIILQGRIPIVNIEIDKKTKEMRLGLKAASSSYQYVALSHVWADGLGNPTSNSLPRCQIERLGRQIASLPLSGNVGGFFVEDTPADFVRPSQTLSLSRSFWMDTLCVPVGDENREIRQEAINKMAAVYAGASHVLVLDRELQQLKLGSRPFREHLGYMICCTWAGRSWTFQEGCLANSCYF